MALFTDGPISCMDDLTAQDSQLLNVASVEGIDVTQKLALAQDEIAMEVHTLLTRFGFAERLFWVAPQPALDSVVVTPPLKLWNTARTLELFYSDAYNSQLNDRYAGKRDQFHALARWAYDKLIQTGLGIAAQPVPRPAVPVLTTVPGALSDNTYYVTMTWVNSAGEEGAPAPQASIATSSSTYSVQPGSGPKNATGWNVYAGVTPGNLVRQNVSLLPLGQSWIQPAALTVTGPAPGAGQQPAYLQAAPRVIQRG